MADFWQPHAVTTIHDLATNDRDQLEATLRECSDEHRIGLVLPVTAGDMRADPFAKIMQELQGADYIDTICVVMGIAPDRSDYEEAKAKIAPLGEKAKLVWTDGPRVQSIYTQLSDAGFRLGSPGKGLSVWTAFGYLLADHQLKSFALHDCDIVDYDRILLARLCLPIAHPSLDFEFCKAFYSRCTDRMHGRAVRLLVIPLLRALHKVLGDDPFISYMASFRYPLAGEFAMTASLARSNRIPSDWGLEVGSLAEVYRNISLKKTCQVDLCFPYEHKHQSLSIEDPGKGLMKMAVDIVMNIFRTLSSRGTVLQNEQFATLRSAYLRDAQDAIRQYHADSLVNGLTYDRHSEEHAVEGFANRIADAAARFSDDPTGDASIPNWTRVLAALPSLPDQLRQAALEDSQEATG